MSTLAELQSAVDEYTQIWNDATVTLSAYSSGLNSIDPASPDAQTTYDTIIAERKTYADTKREEAKQKGAIVDKIKAELSSDDLAQTETIEQIYKDAIKKYEAESATYRELKDTVQRSITNAAPIPRANVQPATVRQVDNAIYAAPIKTSDSLGKFIKIVKSTGLVLGSKYAVQLPPIASFDMNNINMLCNVAGMPEISITGADSRIYGESAEIPNGAAYGMLQLSFLVTNEFDTLGYFEAWSNIVYDRLNRTVGYYKDFAFPITVQVLDRGGNPRYTVYFMDCWPKSINTSGLSYDQHGTMTVNVTMQYKYWMSSITGKLNPDTTPPWDGRPSSLQLPAGATVGPYTNVGASLDPSSAVGIYGNNGLAAATAMGPRIGSDLLSASTQSAAALKSLQGMSEGTSIGGLLSKYANQLGTSSSVMGSGIGSIASNLTTILAPAGQIARGVAGISGALGSMDNLLSRMGIKTNIGNTVSNLNGVAGQIAVLGQLNGIPGAMSSLGSSIGSISGDIAAIQRSLVNVPGATKNLNSSLGNLSNVFTASGNNISALGNMNYVN